MECLLQRDDDDQETTAASNTHVSIEKFEVHKIITPYGMARVFGF